MNFIHRIGTQTFLKPYHMTAPQLKNHLLDSRQGSIPFPHLEQKIPEAMVDKKPTTLTTVLRPQHFSRLPWPIWFEESDCHSILKTFLIGICPASFVSFSSFLDCNWRINTFEDFIARVRIQIANLWCQKRRLCQLRHNTGPILNSKVSLAGHRFWCFKDDLKYFIPSSPLTFLPGTLS